VALLTSGLAAVECILHRWSHSNTQKATALVQRKLRKAQCEL